MQLELTFKKSDEKEDCGAEDPDRQLNSKRSEETRRERVRANWRRYRSKNYDRVREIERRSKQKHRTRRLAKQHTAEFRYKAAAYQREYRNRLTPEQKERRRVTNLEWCRTHRAIRSQQNKASRERHWDRVLKNCRDYRRRNGAKVRGFFRRYLPDYRAKQRRTNPQFLLAERMRARLKRALSKQGLKKVGRTRDYFGCIPTELRASIEQAFVNGMAWDKPESFAIDHLVPISAFDLVDPEELFWSFNWRNLRLLDPLANSRKSNKLPTPLPDWLPAHIAARILKRYAPDF